MSQHQVGLKKSRRNFIKKGIAGLAGAVVLPSALKGESMPQTTPPPKAEQKGKMIYRTLGNTGIKLPIVSMGVMNADNPELVKAALDAGIVHLDTAWAYQMGRNEEMIGQQLKGRPRDSYVIATKINEPKDKETGLFPPDAKADTFIEKFQTSLKRLGLDYVDILYLHNITRKESAVFEPYLEALKKLKKEGKTRFIGVSTHRNEPEVIRAAADSKVYDVVLTSYNFKQLNLADVEAAIAYAAKAGLGIVAMKTQAGVYWDGKEKKFPINMKAALKWALQNENIHTAIPGFTTFDQMNLDLSVMEDLTLTPEEKAALQPPKELATAGLYCQQCEKCLRQCPAKLEIPTLMRSYMYAYGYKNPGQARQTLDAVDLSRVGCNDCGTCRVKCAVGIDIKNRVQDIIRLKDVPQDFLV
ncbi:MAG TPA: aldo/keto reductase [Candidatus Deferrimicrobium sp.]|nr:aldo/keto reductase [Candidatus Deferrimicrobium sp.]